SGRSCFAGGFDVVRDLERSAEAQSLQIPRRARLVSRRQPPMVSRMNQNDSRLMTQTPGRILGVSALALTFAAGLAQPALAQAETAPAPTAAAQTPQVQMAQPEAERALVNRILVRGNQRIDQTTVLSYLPIQPGDTIDAVTIDVAVRT